MYKGDRKNAMWHKKLRWFGVALKTGDPPTTRRQIVSHIADHLATDLNDPGLSLARRQSFNFFIPLKHSKVATYRQL